MPDAAYLLDQADCCLRLARTCSDPGIAARLQALAEDFTAEAAGMETDEPMPPPHIIKRRRSPDGDRGRD